MGTEKKIKVVNAYGAEALQTGEGVMRPFLFTENVSLMHLEIPTGMKVAPHAHPQQGILYCLKGELEVFSAGNKFAISGGTAIVVPANVEVGVNNKSNSPVECLLISSPPTFKSAEELKERLKQFQSQHKE